MFLSHLVICFLLSLADASPLVRRQNVDCAPDSPTGLKAECWESLGVDKFIQDWMAANATAADCGNLGFAQCYLQFNGLTTLTCDLITSSTCPPPSSSVEYSSNQHFYVLWNIYAVYQFFNQYSQAMSNGVGLAGQTVGKIVSAVAPPVEANEPESALLGVLTSTIGIVSTFAGVIPGGAGTAVNLIAGGISQALEFNKGVSDALLKQTANDRFIQLGDISASLAELVADYQLNLLDAVSKIQRDDATFRAACSTGGFSQRITTSLTIQSNELYRQLQLFVLSSTLRANGIVSAKSTGLSALQVATETDQISCTALSPGGFCNQWWIDNEGNTYSFHNPGDTANTHVALTAMIVDEGWATLDQVFKVEACAGQKTAFDPATLGLGCIATHGFCEWNYQPDLAQTRAQPQFKNCDNDPNWGTLCSSFEERILIPESYLGPILKPDKNGFSQFCKSL
ncbi:uncharacterized protein B0I36DRAFT_312941 [Microdochium trichocladiopsis]|uniref:Cyanovirin-N domain-containing protein n=1 Tax=Microdochium trichocladiopsis TaxID=1682393 RepID=A0A9P9C0V8_9PEZI|nr:uncharacterized protein B0I36DRAFT_312941 [Microdochium trichocladiopsis]KAH7041504.1 hypothetical protein B0I36DRAFT_312941 [Microdochium trichocladiopsis]